MTTETRLLYPTLPWQDRPERQPVMGLAEVAVLLRLTKQRVHTISKQEGFPKPIAELRMGFVWRTSDILAWKQEVGR